MTNYVISKTQHKEVIWNRPIPNMENCVSAETFIPPVSQGRVIKCYDGDTITIATYLPIPESPLYKFSVRLDGIDCPEIRGKNENEKQCAKLAKKFVEDMLLGNMVTLNNIKLEKYGRILADVIFNDASVSSALIANKLAVPYDGGKKNVPDDWMHYHVT